MNQLCVWAPNAKSVELVTKDKESFSPPVLLTPTSIAFRGQTISGYWRTLAGTDVLQDSDGYWFKIVFDNGETRYRIDPYARALITARPGLSIRTQADSTGRMPGTVRLRGARW
jgi:1,4-alpha-glucan branching enzyme